VTEDFDFRSQVGPSAVTPDGFLAVKDKRKACSDVGHDKTIPSVLGIFNPVHRGPYKEEVESVMKELAIPAVLKSLVVSGAPAIAEKISSRNDHEVIIGIPLDLHLVGGEGPFLVWRFQVGDELQVVAVEAV
jgi:hypothetical protein